MDSRRLSQIIMEGSWQVIRAQLWKSWKVNFGKVLLLAIFFFIPKIDRNFSSNDLIFSSNLLLFSFKNRKIVIGSLNHWCKENGSPDTP